MTAYQRAPGHSSHAGAPSAAMAATQVLSRLSDLARITVQTQASMARESVDLLWTTMAGSMDRASAHKAYVQSVARESARYWREVGELGVDYATDLVALGKSVSATVLRELAAAGRWSATGHTAGHTSGHTSGDTAGSTESTRLHDGHRGRGARATHSQRNAGLSSVAADHDGGERRAEVSLRGPVGGRAEGKITVANRHPRPRRIQLRAGDLVDSAGAATGAVLDVSPTSVTVPSEQERSVSLRVNLADASFSPGERYSCTVTVSGGDKATIEVPIEVRS